MQTPDNIVELLLGGGLVVHRRQRDQAILRDFQNARDAANLWRRRDWALCVPYEFGGVKPFFPDFIVVRKKGSSFEVDILEPHDSTRADTWAKARGLAAFADLHGMEFGRLIIARKKGDQFQKVDMNDKTTRQRARSMQSQNDLESLFGS